MGEFEKELSNMCVVVNLLLVLVCACGCVFEVVCLIDCAMACDAISTVRLNLLKSMQRYDDVSYEVLRL